jgi:hypothetical protein
MKLLLLASLFGATWVANDTQDMNRQAPSMVFSCTIVSSVSLAFEEHWRGTEGIADGTYSNTATQEYYAFMVPITRDHPTILVPDGLDGMNQEIGVAYVSLQDIGTPVAMGD